MTAPDDEVEAIKGIAADVTADHEEKVAADERERARDYAASRSREGLLLQLIKDCTDAENRQDAFQAHQARKVLKTMLRVTKHAARLVLYKTVLAQFANPAGDAATARELEVARAEIARLEGELENRTEIGSLLADDGRQIRQQEQAKAEKKLNDRIDVVSQRAIDAEQSCDRKTAEIRCLRAEIRGLRARVHELETSAVSEQRARENDARSEREAWRASSEAISADLVAARRLAEAEARAHADEKQRAEKLLADLERAHAKLANRPREGAAAIAAELKTTPHARRPDESDSASTKKAAKLAEDDHRDDGYSPVAPETPAPNQPVGKAKTSRVTPPSPDPAAAAPKTWSPALPEAPATPIEVLTLAPAAAGADEQKIETVSIATKNVAAPASASASPQQAAPAPSLADDGDVGGGDVGVIDQPETPAETCYPGALVPEANDDDVGGTEAPTDVQNAVTPQEPSLLVPDALTALPVAETPTDSPAPNQRAPAAQTVVAPPTEPIEPMAHPSLPPATLPCFEKIPRDSIVAGLKRAYHKKPADVRKMKIIGEQHLMQPTSYSEAEACCVDLDAASSVRLPMLKATALLAMAPHVIDVVVSAVTTYNLTTEQGVVNFFNGAYTKGRVPIPPWGTAHSGQPSYLRALLSLNLLFVVKKLKWGGVFEVNDYKKFLEGVCNPVPAARLMRVKLPLLYLLKEQSFNKFALKDYSKDHSFPLVACARWVMANPSPPPAEEPEEEPEFS